MPQPLSRIKPNAQFTLTTEALVGRPDLADLVTQIIALYAVIEQDLQTLFFRLVDPDEAVAYAVYSMLTSASLQKQALNVVAKSKFGNDSEQFEVFAAVLDVVERTSQIRHRLAHWRWGISPDAPNALLLADSKDAKSVRISHTHMRTMEPLDGENRPQRSEKILKHISFDTSKILVYRIADFESGLADLGQASLALFHLDLYVTPQITDERAADLKLAAGPDFHRAIDVGTSAEALRQLSSLSLFQEARLRLSQGKNKTRQTPSE
ncbi:hypothetical protein [Rhizobium leguminosarum]|uniref:hypothetical protein n=1 Tax=Rhizobium leguminosarum TaxID=384 RepID=UPI001C94D61B|nr:hypothetical protein [Rhizobium leguminosarum]MBY5520150.1 hypothetical protein [Rhizobium leguminosarum]